MQLCNYRTLNFHSKQLNNWQFQPPTILNERLIFEQKKALIVVAVERTNLLMRRLIGCVDRDVGDVLLQTSAESFQLLTQVVEQRDQTSKVRSVGFLNLINIRLLVNFLKRSFLVQFLRVVPRNRNFCLCFSGTRRSQHDQQL